MTTLMRMGAVLLAFTLSVTATQAQLTFYSLGEVNLTAGGVGTPTSLGIGTNISSVAWNGTSLWVGGYNSSGVAGNSGIVRIDTPLSTPTANPVFGQLPATPNTRGITSMAVQGSTLAVSIDLGVASGESIRAFDASAASPAGPLWRIGDATAGNNSTFRGNGVAFDPGFNGGGTNQGVAFLGIGGGRRQLLNTTNGTFINAPGSAAIINFSPTSTVFRDLTFDPSTGDLYSRENNRIGKAVRSGDNSFVNDRSNPIAIGTFANAVNIDNQNIAMIHNPAGAPDGEYKFLVANNRASTSAGQAAATVIQFVALDGTILTSNLASFGIAAGNGAYDFSWDATSQSLAISDFANNRVMFFSPVPEPTSIFACVALVGVAGGAVRRRLRNRAAITV